MIEADANDNDTTSECELFIAMLNRENAARALGECEDLYCL
jgi:hypothetical protein